MIFPLWIENIFKRIFALVMLALKHPLQFLG